jgi:hypothetical protein
MPLNIIGLIDLAIEHLDSYKKRLPQNTNEMLVAKMLGVSHPGKLSSELLEFGKQSVTGLLKDENIYVDECKKSLIEQRLWHADKSSRVPAWGGGKYEKLIGDIQLENSSSRQKDLAKFAYYGIIRQRLMESGFLVAPRGAALGAVFPVEDWLPVPSEFLFWHGLKERTDKLVQKYELLGDTTDALTRMLVSVRLTQAEASILSSAIGCLCISWTRLKHFGQTIYIPILGLSGVVEKEPDAEYFASYCRYLALPTWSPDPQMTDPNIALYSDNSKIEKLKQIIRLQASDLGRKRLLGKKAKPQNEEDRIQLFEFRRMQGILRNYEKKKQQDYDDRLAQAEKKSELITNYETMIERTNQAALGYRARTLLGLRTPGRQALLSYVSFRENKVNKNLKIEKLQDVKDGVDLWICGWHSLNCAEPAALMTASSLLGEGVDVLVCFPYEGFSNTGKFRNRPKETCPWCAAVELGFRSLTRNTGKVDQSINTGKWDTEFSMNIANEPDEVLATNVEFDSRANDNDVIKRTRGTLGGNLVRNKDLETGAYSPVVETKIGRLRSMYHLLGLLDPEVVSLNSPLFVHAQLDNRRELLQD